MPRRYAPGRTAGQGLYPGDLTDAQWQVIVPHLPAEVPGGGGLPRRVWPLRAIVEATLCTGPGLVAPGGTCRTASRPGGRCTGTSPPGAMMARWPGCNDALRAQVRAARLAGDPEPTVAIIDSQSVRAADTMPRATRGWDNAKKVNGRKTAHRRGRDGPAAGRGDHRRLRPGPDAARPLLWNCTAPAAASA